MKLKWMTLSIVLASCCVTFGGEIAELHRKLAKADRDKPDQSRNHQQVEAAGSGVTEIGLERTPCFGTCPVYMLVIKSDGTFRYKGERAVDRKGEYTGKVNRYRFNQLVQFIRDSGYMELQDRYYRAVTDNPTVYTTAVVDGKRKVVSNYASAGPPKLWTIEELIDKLLLEAEWDDKPVPGC
jgi:Domain of unknown function (DUF6438)